MPPDKVPTITREDGPELSYEDGRVWIWAADRHPEKSADLSVADLHWLVTAGGPAMLCLLGGPNERMEATT